MSRRSIALISLAVLALLLALVPWTVQSDWLVAAVTRELKAEYGVDLAVRGRLTVALLPVPRLKLQDVAVSEPGGGLAAEAAQLRVEFRPLQALLLRFRIAELNVAGATARVTVPSSPGAVTDTVLALLRRGSAAGPSPRIERVVVTGSTLDVARAEQPGVTRLEHIEGVLRWPDPTGDLDLIASASWRGEAISVSVIGLNPAALAAGRADLIETKVTTRLGEITGLGELAWRAGPRFSGQISASTPALGALTRWSEVALDLQDFDRSVSVSGRGSLGPEGIEWPQATITLGGDRLEGAIGYRVAPGRPQLRATLAGDSLDLGWLLPIADPAVAEPPRSDYDVRLSASSLRLGPLRLQDTATGILVSGERLEVSLARATLAGGSVRGRLSAALDGEGRDIKGQVTADRIDLGQLLDQVGLPPTLTGTVAGQLAFDVGGDRRPDLLAALRGRAGLTAQDGEIAGVTLGEAPRRQDARPGSAAAGERRGGRTRFTRATLGVEFGQGTAEIADGMVETTGGRTSVRGRVSLRDGSVAIRTVTRTLAPEGEGGAPLVLDLKGPVGQVAVSEVAAGETTSSPARP